VQSIEAGRRLTTIEQKVGVELFFNGFILANEL
jgi:hypothetical protein